MKASLLLSVLAVTVIGCSDKLPAAHACDQRSSGGYCDDFLTGYEDMSKASRESLCEGTALMTPCPTSGIIGECDKKLLANQVHLITRYYEVRAPHTIKTLEVMCTTNSGACAQRQLHFPNNDNYISPI